MSDAQEEDKKSKTTSDSDPHKNEQLVLVCDHIDIANAIRSDLVYKFSGCWFHVYTETANITVTNDFGGRLKDDTFKRVKAYATALNPALSTSQSNLDDVSAQRSLESQPTADELLSDLPEAT